MKTLAPPKKTKKPKDERELDVLFGLIRLFIEEGKPIGSETLRAKGFESLSSATIRNYYVTLEERGFLSQQHTSGGRVPTAKAFRQYAETILKKPYESFKHSELGKKIAAISQLETREVVSAVQKICFDLSHWSRLAVCISAPRFDGEIIQDVRVVLLDDLRLMVILMTDFGAVYSEVLQAKKPMSTFSAKRIENYFRLRLFNLPKPDDLESDELELALSFYNETLIRYLVGLTQFGEPDLYKTGLAQLLVYPEFHDHPQTLCESLVLFEERKSLRHILHETSEKGTLQILIGDDLSRYSITPENLTILSIPYKIGEKVAGAFALIGPMRMAYEQVIPLALNFSDSLSQMLTHNLYHFKIGVKTKKRKPILLESPQCKLLENRRYP